MASEAPASIPRERTLSTPLMVFLALVGVACVAAFVARLQSRVWVDPVSALADGDLDADERKVMLGKVMRQGAQSEEGRGWWLALMAAVALSDREACAEMLARLEGAESGVPRILPAPDQRQFLDLGDPMLANLAKAWWAEAAGDRARARVLWAQVASQCRMSPCPLAAELATAALERLR